ncbi:MAG: hypothetical protein MUF43_10425 [Flavobacterium sp.]|jgi:hypothetical protein|nr:hypothetical protein [Flavobacterium sp.]
MNDFLVQMLGKKLDISCGATATVRGEVVDVKDGIVYLRDENERVAYVSIDKIAVVWEVKENESRAGFVV